MRNRKVVISFIALAVGVATVAGFLWERPDSSSGVTAIVTNGGTAPMRNVRVVVTGHTYSLGDLSAKEMRTVRLEPSGESHIVLTYVDESGGPQSLPVDCYFEPRYSGEIEVDVADGKVIRVSDRISISPRY